MIFDCSKPKLQRRANALWYLDDFYSVCSSINAEKGYFHSTLWLVLSSFFWACLIHQQAPRAERKLGLALFWEDHSVLTVKTRAPPQVLGHENFWKARTINGHQSAGKRVEEASLSCPNPLTSQKRLVFNSFSHRRRKRIAAMQLAKLSLYVTSYVPIIHNC